MIHVFSYWCSRLGGHPQTSLAHFDSPRFPHPAQGPESRISPPSHQLLPQQHHSRAGLQHLTALPFPPMGPIKPSPPKSSCHSPTSVCCHPQGSACCPGLGLFAHCPAASWGRCRKEPLPCCPPWEPLALRISWQGVRSNCGQSNFIHKWAVHWDQDIMCSFLSKEINQISLQWPRVTKVTSEVPCASYSLPPRHITYTASFPHFTLSFYQQC